MSRFTTGTPQTEMRYDTVDPSEITPEFYLEGNAETGFNVTAAPPELGFWGVTFHDSQVNAALMEPGNVATWLMNNAVSPMVEGSQRFTSLGNANLMRQAIPEGVMTEVDGMRWMSDRISPVQNVNEMDQILMFKDEDFVAETATTEWMDQPGNQIKRDLIEKQTGRDVEAIANGARNRNHHHFLIMRELQAAKARQNMDNWSEESGIFANTVSYGGSAIFNYMLTDPTFAPSLVIPVGGVGKLGQAGAGIGKVNPPCSVVFFGRYR